MVLDDQGKVLTQAEAQVRIDAPQVEDDHKKLPFIPRNFMMK
jgi:hypothetical protein